VLEWCSRLPNLRSNLRERVFQLADVRAAKLLEWRNKLA
jgi:hypothetical protein